MIDVNFDFTMDSPNYWDNFWNNNYGLGGGNCDPDSESPMLKKYHSELWSKVLPNGECLELKMGSGTNYLYWKNMRFGSDSIIASFRYNRCKPLIQELKNEMLDYHLFVENFLHKAYTIGGSIILPKHKNSINQARGTNKLICDRWDLTLECIRRYYNNEDNPIYMCLEQDKNFFELFSNFKGYVDFFFLQDMVDDNYSKVNLWLEQRRILNEEPLPSNVKDYLKYINKELDFVEKRNNRIQSYLNEHEH